MKSRSPISMLNRWVLAISPFGRALIVTLMLCLRAAAGSGSEAPTNSPGPAARATDKPVAATNVVTTPNGTNSPVDKEYEDLISLDDEAHAEVDRLGRRWLHDGTLSSAETEILHDILHNLRAIYREHIKIEDTEVFPLAGQILPSSALKSMGREMAERRGLDIARLPAVSRCAERRLMPISSDRHSG